MQFDNLKADVANILASSDYARARSAVVGFLNEAPNCIPAYQLLASILELQNEPELAKECYLGRLSKQLQSSDFKADYAGRISSGVGVSDTIIHASESTTPISFSISTTHQINRYKSEKLVSKPTRLIVADHGGLWHDGFNTVLFDKNGSAYADALNGNLAPVLNAMETIDPLYIKGRVILLGSRGANNYYHWMTDILPKLDIIKKSGIRLDDSTRYVLTNVTAKFQIETLERFGIRKEQIHFTRKQGQYIQAREIVVPVLSNRMGLSMGSWLLDYLKSMFAIDNTVKQYRKLLISRDPAVSHGRGIANVKEFNAHFESRGYELLIPDRYTVAQQATLFSQAVSVVGAHGAGLANLVFCKEECDVFEFYGKHIAPCYWAISELGNLNYVNFNCNENSSVKSGSDSQLIDAKTLKERRSCGFRVPLESVGI